MKQIPYPSEVIPTMEGLWLPQNIEAAGHDCTACKWSALVKPEDVQPAVLGAFWVTLGETEPSGVTWLCARHVHNICLWGIASGTGDNPAAVEFAKWAHSPKES